jgi:hypothetical protein
MPDVASDTGDGFFRATEDDFGADLGAGLRARLESELERNERVLWSSQGLTRPLGMIRVFPALFAAFLCGTSGFALMVLFGIYGLRKMNPGEMLFLLCLAPGALGGMAAIGIARSWVHHWLWQRRIARTLYMLTDRRGIVAWNRHGADDFTLCVWTTETFDGTLCVEHRDGTGAVYFCRDGEVLAPQWGFEGIRDSRRVDELIRQILLGEKIPLGVDLAEL